ncbi:MAG: tetratricopeptide (TPR) repeat protein, partial [Rhodothermales bacterium]
TEARLEAYHKAEANFETASARSWKSHMKALENGKAGSSWYKKYEAASEDQQGAMVQEWIGKQMENDSGLVGHRQRFIDAASVVPHAMDLGILLLQHAQGLEDADVRRAELESSEAIFMSVQGAAGDNPQYQLFLGQVKYWLGKSAEGEALFTQFLSSGDPDEPPFSAMLAVASTYREVGETAKARALYEDVYNRADDEEIKDSAANMRAITATATDDSLHWLKLCKAQSPSLRANLAANLGLKAAADGDVDEAVHKFKEAIKIYDKMPESSVTLNNSALVFGHIFNATGNVEQHSQGVARLRKAHSLSPEDSITMGNFARHLNTSAALAVTSDAIDYPVLREHASSSLFSSIATDRDGRLALEKRMLENAEFREAANGLSKARVLSPKSLHLYSNLVRVYSLQGDVDGLKKLYTDLVAAELDLTQMNAEFLDIYAGNQDETRLADAQYEFADYQARAKADVGASPPTAALLHIYVADAVENLWNLNRSVDPDLAIQAAEAAVAIHSSQNARRTLAGSYILRGAASTLPETAEFAKFAAMNSIVSTVAVALNGKDEAVRNAILGNADFKKGFALYKAEALADDEAQGPWLWAMARHADAEFANTVAAKVKADELSHVSRQIVAAMTPLSGGSIYGLAWAAELGGDIAGAGAILAQARAAGVPLP